MMTTPATRCPAGRCLMPGCGFQVDVEGRGHSGGSGGAAAAAAAGMAAAGAVSQEVRDGRWHKGVSAWGKHQQQQHAHEVPEFVTAHLSTTWLASLTRCDCALCAQSGGMMYPRRGHAKHLGTQKVLKATAAVAAVAAAAVAASQADGGGGGSSAGGGGNGGSAGGSGGGSNSAGGTGRGGSTGGSGGGSSSGGAGGGGSADNDGGGSHQ